MFLFFFFRWVSIAIIFHLCVQLCVQKASRLISFLPFTLQLIINSPHTDNAVENKSTIFHRWCSLPTRSPLDGRAVCCFYLMCCYFGILFFPLIDAVPVLLPVALLRGCLLQTGPYLALIDLALLWGLQLCQATAASLRLRFELLPCCPLVLSPDLAIPCAHPAATSPPPHGTPNLIFHLCLLGCLLSTPQCFIRYNISKLSQ